MSTPTIDLAAVRASLIAEADAAHAQYPQYAGHWDNYRTGVLKRDIRTKRGVVGRKGQRVLAVRGSLGTPAGYLALGEVTAYLDGCDTLIGAGDITFDPEP